MHPLKFGLIKKTLHIILLVCSSLTLSALDIKGTVELPGDWQPKVFLASLNSPQDFFVASPDFLIAEAFVNPDGSFELTTESVPAEFTFYRLYLVRGDNSSVEFNSSANRNYFHLLLKRETVVEINARIENNALVVDKLIGSEETESIIDFDRQYLQKSTALGGNVTKAQSDYLTHDLEVFIRDFVEKSSNALVGLYALYHIDAKDTDFLRNSEFYFDFQKRMHEEFPQTAYTQVYDELLNELVGFRDFVCEMPGVQPKWKDQLLIAQAVVIFLLLVIVTWLLIKARKNSRVNVQKNGEQKKLFEGLTQKQLEILRLLSEGKTNKEIAQELFIELSTVKTHINNIYRQLNVTTRKEAANYFNRQNN